MKLLFIALAAWLFAGSAVAAGPPIPPNAPTIATVAGLGPLMKSQGWNPINSWSDNLAQGALGTPSQKGGSLAGATAVISEISPVSVPKIRLVFDAYYDTGTSAEEVPYPNPIYVSAAAWNLTTGKPTQVTFNGDASVRMGKQIVVSDPVAFPVAANAGYTLREAVSVTSSSLQFGATALMLPTSWNPSSVEGTVAEDGTMVGSVAVQTVNQTTAYGHITVLGYTGTSPVKSLACAGDSRIAGYIDGSGATYQLAGYCVRACNGSATVSVQYPSITPTYGCLLAAHVGSLLSNFILTGQHEERVQAANFYSTVLDDLGINDVGAGMSIATFKADKIIEVGLFLCGGVPTCTPATAAMNRFIAATMEPNTTTTDGWTTANGQTVKANEANRVGDNDWYRDASANGFVLQASAAIGLPPSYIAVFDAANYVECNSSNVKTQDGGRWCAPTTSPLYSGTITSGASASGFIDTGLAGAASNLYRGDTIVWTSGPLVNVTGASIQANITGSGQVYIQGSNTSPGASATYSIYDSSMTTVDGLHASSGGANVEAVGLEAQEGTLVQ